jgi:hypothetical protein
VTDVAAASSLRLVGRRLAVVVVTLAVVVAPVAGVGVASAADGASAPGRASTPAGAAAGAATGAGAAAVASAAGGTTVTLADRRLAVGGTTAVPVRLTAAPEGLAGYSLTVRVADPSVATVESVEFVAGGGVAEATVGADGATARLDAADVDGSVRPGATGTTLARVVVRGSADGETNLSVAVRAMDADDGASLDPATEPARLSVRADPVAVVAADGSGDYRSLATAAREAGDGYTLRVREGTYAGGVVLDANVTVDAAPGAVVAALDPAGTGVRVEPGSHAAPVVRGLTVRGFEDGVGVDASGTAGDWRLENVTVTDSHVGVAAGYVSFGPPVSGRPGAAGDWTVANSTVRGFRSVVAAASTGEWTVRDSRLNGTFQASDATGRFRVANVTVVDAGFGLDARGSAGAFRVTDTVVRGAVVGLGADDATGDWVARNLTVLDAESGGVRALDAAGDWTVAASTVARPGRYGVSARGATGAWTLRRTAVAGSGGPGVLAAESAGDGRVVLSAVVANDGPGVDATGADATLDATGNWWGRASGPAEGQCVGDVYCAEPLADPPVPIPGGGGDDGSLTADAVVAADGSGDYDSVAAAVNATAPDATVLVRAGVYREPTVVLNGSRTLVGESGATLVGDGPGDVADATGAFSIPAREGTEDPAAPTVRGFTVRDRTVGIVAPDTAGDWTARNLTVRNTTVAAVASGASGDWTVRNVTHRPPAADAPSAGVLAADTTGDWTVRGLDAARVVLGVTASGSGGAWRVTDSRLVDVGTGVNADGTSGRWRVADVAVAVNESRAAGTAVSLPVGVVARDAVGAWTAAHVRVEDAAVGVDASGTAGDWRVEDAVLTGNEVGLGAVGTTGAWTVTGSRIGGNAVDGVNATRADPAGDATGNWWGREGGPADGQCVGSVDCGDPLAEPPADAGPDGGGGDGPTLVVAADGSGDYDSVAAAVAAAPEGGTVRVREGDYRETNVTLARNVTVVGEPGATLVGEGPRVGGPRTVEGDAAFRIPAGSFAAPTVRGVTLRDHDVGVVAVGTAGDWTVRNLTLRNTRGVANAIESTGDWTLRDVTHRPPTADSYDLGVVAGFSTGDWTVAGLETRAGVVGVSGLRSRGDWTVTDSRLVDVGTGVDALGAAGAWVLTDTTVAVNDSRSFADPVSVPVGIRANGTDGDWTASDVRVESARLGLQASRSTGRWRVERSGFADNGVAVDARNATATWVVTGSSVVDNGVGVDATGADPAGDATGNWWGRESGPAEGQCVGSVDCGDPLAEPPADAGTDALDAALPRAVRSDAGSPRRPVALPAAVVYRLDAPGSSVRSGVAGRWSGGGGALAAAGTGATVAIGAVAVGAVADGLVDAPPVVDRPSVASSVASRPRVATGPVEPSPTGQWSGGPPAGTPGLGGPTPASAATRANGSGANWTRTVGGGDDDRLVAAAPAADGPGYVAVGTTRSRGPGTGAAWLVRVGPDGSVRFDRTYGGLGVEVGADVLALADGYLLVGSSTSFGGASSEATAIRLGPRGDVRWFRAYGGPGDDRALAATRTDDGFALAGDTRSFGNGSADGWLVRVAPDGAERSNRTFGGPGRDRLADVAATSDGGLVLAGTRADGVRGTDGWFVRVAPDGAATARTLDRTADEAFRTVAATPAGPVLAGRTLAPGGGNADAWVVGLAPDGTTRWNRTYGGAGDDRVGAATLAGDRLRLVGDSLSFGATGRDGWRLDVASNGTALGDRTVAAGTTDGFAGVAVTPGQSVAVGRTAVDGRGTEGWLVAAAAPSACPSVSGLDARPRDPTDDGRCEDVDGDGDADLDDVFALAFVVLPATGELSARETAAFDFDDDGGVDLDDVFALAFSEP